MCTKYVSPDDAAIERYWEVRPGGSWSGSEMFPRAEGPFIRRVVGDSEPRRECIVGQWGLIPSFAQEPRVPYSTFNARFEELGQKASYKVPWARGQRCLIPATSFDEPCWETGRNVWWRFARRDGAPWGLAGLWNAWVDRATGEVHESYTMLTVNADAHPLMRRLHKPDPKYGPDEQDKRSVVAIAAADVDRWLHGSREEAAALVVPPALELIEAAPVAGRRR
ncbi:MAG: SOS response-associated peptidase family protein [Proteobacteria bacterium]|nr:SOS response-associated peptidase family protein [Pseudomonadota bacterium]